MMKEITSLKAEVTKLKNKGKGEGKYFKYYCTTP